jgi:hypothetical protein
MDQMHGGSGPLLSRPRIKALPSNPPYCFSSLYFSYRLFNHLDVVLHKKQRLRCFLSCRFSLNQIKIEVS